MYIYYCDFLFSPTTALEGSIIGRGEAEDSCYGGGGELGVSFSGSREKEI